MKFPRAVEPQGCEKQSNYPQNQHPNRPNLLPLKIASSAPVNEEETYRPDIERFLINTSPRLSSNGNYFAAGMDITEHMRGVLLGWLVEVHQKYRLTDETFFLMVGLLDSYLEREWVSRSRLQLAGITALWIAAKYVETYQVPKLDNLVYICDNAYCSQDILQMEGSILTAVGFGALVRPSPLTYLALIQHHANLQPKDYFLAKYLLEVAAFDLSLRPLSPALIAYSIVFFIKKLRGYQRWQQQTLKDDCSLSEGQIRSTTRELCQLWQRSQQWSALKSLKNKYSSKKCMQVAKIRLAERSS